MGEVKMDLKRLEGIEPHRFFYAKHLIALRVVMNRRLQKLKDFTDEGWLTPADGERLVLALQDRIVQADQFFPRLRQTSKAGTGSIEALSCNAWDDFDVTRGSPHDTGTNSVNTMFFMT